MLMRRDASSLTGERAQSEEAMLLRGDNKNKRPPGAPEPDSNCRLFRLNCLWFIPISRRCTSCLLTEARSPGTSLLVYAEWWSLFQLSRSARFSIKGQYFANTWWTWHKEVVHEAIWTQFSQSDHTFALNPKNKTLSQTHDYWRQQRHLFSPPLTSLLPTSVPMVTEASYHSLICVWELWDLNILIILCHMMISDELWISSSMILNKPHLRLKKKRSIYCKKVINRWKIMSFNERVCGGEVGRLSFLTALRSLTLRHNKYQLICELSRVISVADLTSD